MKEAANAQAPEPGGRSNDYEWHQVRPSSTCTTMLCEATAEQQPDPFAPVPTHPSHPPTTHIHTHTRADTPPSHPCRRTTATGMVRARCGRTSPAATSPWTPLTKLTAASRSVRQFSCSLRWTSGVPTGGALHVCIAGDQGFAQARAARSRLCQRPARGRAQAGRAVRSTRPPTQGISSSSLAIHDF